MSIIITTNPEVTNYRNAPGVNQSSLKELAKGRIAYLKALEERTGPTPEYFIIGGGVDVQLMGEDGLYEELYYVSTLEKLPTEAEKSITTFVFETALEKYGLVDKPLEAYLRILEQAVEGFEYYKNRKMSTNTANLIESCSAYFKELSESLGKTIISSAQDSKIKEIANSIVTHPRLSKFFDRNYASPSNVDIYYQVPIFFTIDNIDCKGLLDIVVVERNEDGSAGIVTPIDFKTTSGQVIDFPKSIRSFRYDIQAAFYLDGLKINPPSYLKVTPYTKFEDFLFIVESTTSPGTPTIFKTDESLLDVGRYGKTTPYSKYYGYLELLIEYEFQQNTDWVEDSVITKNNGVIPINWEGVIS